MPAALPPGKKPGTHGIESWAGPRDGPDRCGKISLPSGFDLRTILPVDLSTRNPTWIALDSNPRLQAEKPVTNHLSHATASPNWSERHSLCLSCKLRSFKQMYKSAKY
jgi:hypothetical protein